MSRLIKPNDIIERDITFWGIYFIGLPLIGLGAFKLELLDSNQIFYSIISSFIVALVMLYLVNFRIINKKKKNNQNYKNKLSPLLKRLILYVYIDLKHLVKFEEGGIKTISQQKPNMIIEIEERYRKGAIKYVYSLMKNLGYDVFFFYDNTLHDFSNFDIKIHQNKPLEAADYRAIEIVNYVNNFIFVQNKKILL